MNSSIDDRRSVFTSFFQTEEHQPFSLNGGQPAAILVHGFPGSPAEMRPLGLSLNRAGWSVFGLLLPGFGPDLDTLPQRRYQEWVDSVQRNIQRLAQSHRPMLIVGFSLGAAVAMQAVERMPPDGLILLAPFIELESLLWKSLPVTRHLFPAIRPFRLFKLDFKDKKIRLEMDKFMPGTNWDDPIVQKRVHEFTLPVGILDEIRKAGRQAFKIAPRLRLPTLIVQGSQDQLVAPRLTRKLLKRFPQSPQYLEVPAEHNLLHPDQPSWFQVESAVLRFASSLIKI